MYVNRRTQFRLSNLKTSSKAQRGSIPEWNYHWRQKPNFRWCPAKKEVSGGPICWAGGQSLETEASAHYQPGEEGHF